MNRLTTFAALLAAAALLAGCASLENAGYSGYAVTKAATGAGFEFKAADGKEHTGREITFKAATGELTVKEGASKAFKGQGVAAKAAALLPVNDLAEIIKGDK